MREIAATHLGLRQVAQSLRQVASSVLLLRQVWLHLFCRCNMSHEFKPVSIRATDGSDNDFHMAICHSDVSQQFVA